MYLILGDLLTNQEYNQEIYKLMKIRDVNNGQVHNLIRGIYNKNKNNVQTKTGNLPGKPPPPIIKNVSK